MRRLSSENTQGFAFRTQHTQGADPEHLILLVRQASQLKELAVADWQRERKSIRYRRP